jgi:hypothetical protein
MTPVVTGSLKVSDLVEAYLAWDQKRVKAGQRDSEAHNLTIIKMRRVCKTVVDGEKFGNLNAHVSRG